MSGNFTRLRYDNNAYNEKLSRSTRPSEYRLNENYAVNCNNCFAPSGVTNPATVEVDQIDIDSILKGLFNSLSKSNDDQKPISLNDIKTALNIPCEKLDSQFTRFTYPSFELKGKAPADMRLGYPLRDPQCNIFENFSVNTRLQAKDNHIATYQRPLDQQKFMPSPREQKPTCITTKYCI
jgi:hypothetical protein